MQLFRLLTSFIVASVVIAAPSPEAQQARKFCRHPSLRKEWRTLTAHEKRGFLNAINCLAKKPHSKKLKATYPRPEQAPVSPKASFLDDIAYLHMDLTGVIHYTGLFLPWHRWYVNAYFNELKEQCGYNGPFPYWDVSKDAEDLSKSPIFAADGFGGFGNEKNNYEIKSGALKNLVVQYPVPHKIRRQYSPYPYLNFPGSPNPNEHVSVALRPSVMRTMVNSCVGDFECFHNATEPPHTFHASVHLGVGGDLGGFCTTGPFQCAGISSNDPLFFLHHANIDRIWAEWQNADPANKNAFSGGSVASGFFNPNGLAPMLSTNASLPTSGLFPVKTVADVMDTAGGYLCYKYV